MNNQNNKTLTDWFFNLPLETKLNIYNKYKDYHKPYDFMHIFITNPFDSYTNPSDTETSSDSQTGGIP